MSVFYQIAERPLMTLGGGHFVSDAITLCGGRNVFADADQLMAPVVNVESVLAADPEAIVAATRDELAGVLAPLPGPARGARGQPLHRAGERDAPARAARDRRDPAALRAASTRRALKAASPR